MRAFSCDHCRSLIVFENSLCVTCGSALGFDREQSELVVETSTPQGLRYTRGDGTVLLPCANLDLASCNWLAVDGAPDGLCSGCLLTRTRPANDDPAGLLTFAAAETAKRRLVYQLDVLGLPTTPRSVDPAHGLAFDLLSSAQGSVITGHDSGLITIDLAEGNDSHRAAMRLSLAEPYRTLLGHLRHEVGHWYWDVLIDGSNWLNGFREFFGDERLDYSAALGQHYDGRPNDTGWANRYVSKYASSHPWEDWAETFAHYLHIRDTIETMASYRVRVDGPPLDLATSYNTPVAADPERRGVSFDNLISSWLPMTFALNAINRSMGESDLYPFVLAPQVLTKLRFVHDRITALAGTPQS
ncbi:hypothetical protein SAMN05892883_2702 [Jatrophihabitans sp. GAS493]|uniref:zinc-binding metallopeptidase family protein n=1 Tax=Jatrophihabitans sp. GAS493 TaxID=1907575 RepID=UPI000BB90D7F|nr:putative zinc-binding metallopeptidase [Jatrophihabitans sp. GAS493]SOD73409.1 hypothetical protein SAMN05892883_2702 [Jatrophihabitans sp. GAS493]